jgi:hypothetical protein
MIRRTAVGALFLCTSMIAGCTDDRTPPVDVHGPITSDLGDLLREANTAIVGTRDVLPAPFALALFERVLGIHTPLAEVVHQIAAQLAAEPARIDVDRTIAYLNDQLFDDASQVGDGLYRILPERVCRPAASPGGSGGDLDTACAATFGHLQPRIRTAAMPVTPAGASANGGVVFALQLGAAHDEVLTVTLAHTQLAPSLILTSLRAELDLNLLQGALDGLAGVADATVPRTALSGHLIATLQGDPTGAALSLRIDRPLAIRIAGESGALEAADAVVLSSAASEVPVFGVVLAPASPGGTLHVNLGATVIQLPARADGRRFGLDLAGLTAAAALEGYLPLEVVDIGFGGRPAVVTVNGARAQTIDINPSDGHDVNVLVQRDEEIDAEHTLQFNPRLDLRMTADHAALGDAVPLYDTTRVFLDGIVRTTPESNRLEVTSGTYRLETDPAGNGFEAAAGQCVTGVEANAPGSPPVVQWSVGACP